MLKYVPFLKLKSNEIFAVSNLEDPLKNVATPFFDFPRKDDLTEDVFLRTAQKLERSVTKNLKGIPFFYLDNFDISSSLTVAGEDSYQFLINIFSGHNFVPVISIDRGDTHIDAVFNSKNNQLIESDVVAIRLCADDFESFAVTNIDIQSDLASVIGLFGSVDVIFDCRVCVNFNAKEVGTKISSFINAFSSVYTVRRTIVTGSSIQPSIGNMLRVESNTEFLRNELGIYREAKAMVNSDIDLYLGDYSVVSPNYSDVNIPGYAMLNIMTPKIVYSFDDKHYIIRGGAIKTHPRGRMQFNDFSGIIVGKPFYRGVGYSFGDEFLEEKSRYVGSSVMPGTILKPTINAHISYMMKSFPD